MKDLFYKYWYYYYTWFQDCKPSEPYDNSSYVYKALFRVDAPGNDAYGNKHRFAIMKWHSVLLEKPSSDEHLLTCPNLYIPISQISSNNMNGMINYWIVCFTVTLIHFLFISHLDLPI